MTEPLRLWATDPAFVPPRRADLVTVDVPAKRMPGYPVRGLPLCVAFGLMLAGGLPGTVDARITEIRLQSVRPFANGAPVGNAGAYERVTGIAKGELDPKDPRNAVIVNIDRAPLNARGRVEYEVDFDMLRPVQGGNRKILFEATNRGRKLLPFFLLDGPPANANNPTEIAHLGNALYLRQGWTLVWAGWDPNAPTANNGLVVRVPHARGQVHPVSQTIRDEFQSGTRANPVTRFQLSYPSTTTDNQYLVLTVRRRESDQRVPLPRDQWKMADNRTLEILSRGAGGVGPAVGSIYELHYPARDPAIAGIGFAAQRDLVSFLRYEAGDDQFTPNPAGRGITTALAVGISQSGRYLRDHIVQGFNQDEGRRKVFDGVLAHISGVGRVFLNAEFSQPFRTNTQHEDHLFPENEFPFSAAKLDDPVTGRRGALLRGDGFDPLLIETNTSTEYWQKGAALLHVDPLGRRDVALPSGARVYLVAGTQHGGRAGLSSARGPCLNDRNPHDPSPVLRALFAALDEWVTKGVAPPASVVPTLAAKTLVRPEAVRFPALPDFGVARAGNELKVVADWTVPRQDGNRRYLPLVSAVDRDGNEVGGIRTPDIAVPLGTYTGWNLYKAPYPDGELCDRDGSYLPFAATLADREKSGDPRAATAERYTSAADYVGRVRAHAEALQRQRLLLPEDVAAYVKRAEQTAAKHFAGR